VTVTLGRLGIVGLVFASLAGVACGPGMVTPDGSTDAGISTDAAPDTSPPSDASDAGVNVFKPCTGDSDCPRGASCNVIGFPRPICLPSCTVSNERAVCGANGACVVIQGSAGFCVPACSRGADCDAYGGACGGVRQDSRTGDVVTGCFPSCVTTATPTRPACTMGMCHAYLGLCTDMAVDTSRGDNGAPCTANDQCRGICETEFDMDPNTGAQVPSGFVGGLCYSQGYYQRPGTSGFAQSNCPAGSVVVPSSTAATTGDLGNCYKSCMTDNDCRAGYQCRTGAANTTGVCLPGCSATRACPANYNCVTQTVQGTSISRCYPNTDGGVPGDSGTDAAADTGTTVNDAGPDTGTGSDAGSTDAGDAGPG